MQLCDKKDLNSWELCKPRPVVLQTLNFWMWLQKKNNIPLHLSYFYFDSLLFENKYITTNLNCPWFIFLLKGCFS